MSVPLLTYGYETNTCHQSISTLDAFSFLFFTYHHHHVCSSTRPATPCLHPGPEQGRLLQRPARQRGISLFLPPFFNFISSLFQLTKYPVLNTLEQRTQVPKTYAVIGGLLFIVFLHTFNALAAPISNLVGWGLPAYLSFKAIESPSPHDDVQWLTYWVVFGFFNFLESFALRLVLYYVPWYFALKSLFIVWLQLPAFRVCPSFHFAVSSPFSFSYRLSSRGVSSILAHNTRILLWCSCATSPEQLFFSVLPVSLVTFTHTYLRLFYRARKSLTSLSSSPSSPT